jgi:hypothetical protein
MAPPNATLVDDATVERPAPPMLLSLMDELLLDIGRHLLAAQLPDALRLAQACRHLHRALEPVTATALARRLQWIAELSHAGEVHEEGRVLTTVASDGRLSWAAGSRLPTSGRSLWGVQVERSRWNQGDMLIGVCDAAARCGWGLYLYNGELYRQCRDANGAYAHDAPPPVGYPHGRIGGQRARLMRDSAGLPSSLFGEANGAVVEVLIDHDEGTLGFRINGGPTLAALRGFPPGATLRPWIRSNCPEAADSVSLVRPYVSELWQSVADAPSRLP